MSPKTLDEMTVEELDEMIQALMAQRAELKTQQVKVQQVRDKKAAIEAAQAKVAALSDVERAAMLQVLAPEGVPSGEVVNGFS